MNTSSSFSSNQSMVIQLEVASDDEQPADIADIDEVGRSLFDQLTQSGYTVKPASTSMKGGGPLYDILLTMPQFLQDNKDWLLASMPLVLECLLIVRKRHAEREKAMRPPLKITLEVNGKPVIIEGNDPQEMVKLLKQLQVTQNNKVRIKVRVPRKKRRP